MTDDEWTLIEPLLPIPACDTCRSGRPEKRPRREIVDAIRYVVDTGCKWRALPADFPPWRTVWGFMARWVACGVIGQIRDALAQRIRREMGKGPRGSGHDHRLAVSQSGIDRREGVPRLRPRQEDIRCEEGVKQRG
jgi:transposase